MNIWIEIDGGAVNAHWTTAAPDGERIFATLAEAKARVLGPAVSEREAWAQCVRDIRAFTKTDIAPAWDNTNDDRD